MKQLRFRAPFRQFATGDPVPAQWDDGVKGTLVQAGRAEWVDVPAADAEAAPSAPPKRGKGRPALSANE